MRLSPPDRIKSETTVASPHEEPLRCRCPRKLRGTASARLSELSGERTHVVSATADRAHVPKISFGYIPLRHRDSKAPFAAIALATNGDLLDLGYADPSWVLCGRVACG